MTEKDRPLLQKIGMKMREIRPAVWIEYVNRSIEKDLAADKYDVAIVDDVRFINEANFFNDNEWQVIRLRIDEDLQQARLQKTYEDGKSIGTIVRTPAKPKLSRFQTKVYGWI